MSTELSATLCAVSALDGRYSTTVSPLSPFFSEYALMKYRVLIEVEWLRALSRESSVPEVRLLTAEENAYLDVVVREFSSSAAERVKEIERATNHDVKAIEYFLKERLAPSSLADLREWIHFGCTSEDINNLAYALMVKGGITEVWLPRAEDLVAAVERMGREYAGTALLARTHGQTASPTTLGKELAVFASRWRRSLRQIKAQEYLGKMNGAVGAFNAHVVAYPDAPWQQISRRFVEGLGLVHNPLTTQIEPHDYLAELFHALSRFNNILLDFDRDMWSYISLGYFGQKTVAGEVGSSTMPHKVNPIDFENSEANVGLANALLEHLASKLQVSRLQRDLSDSSALRSAGSAVAYGYLAVVAALRGLRKCVVNEERIAADLDNAWEVLAEAVQTVMRKHALPNPYERLKDLTRGEKITQEAIRAFVESLELPEAEKVRLLKLTPATYIGLAPTLAKQGG